MKEWNTFLILWLWQLEGSWDSGERRRCQVHFFTTSSPKWWRRRNKVFLTSPLRWGAWSGGQKYSCSCTGHHLDLFLHVVIGLGYDYTGPPTQVGTLDVKWGFWRHGFHISHTIPLLILCFVQLTLGAHAERYSVYLLENWTFQSWW